MRRFSRRLALALFVIASIATRDPSAVCTKCHDGTTSKVMESSHPVAIDYAAAAAKKRDRFKKPPDDFLVDGKVECSTCHFGHDEETDNAFRLRSRDLVKLCTSCHVMD